MLADIAGGRYRNAAVFKSNDIIQVSRIFELGLVLDTIHFYPSASEILSFELTSNTSFLVDLTKIFSQARFS